MVIYCAIVCLGFSNITTNISKLLVTRSANHVASFIVFQKSTQYCQFLGLHCYTITIQVASLGCDFVVMRANVFFHVMNVEQKSHKTDKY